MSTPPSSAPYVCCAKKSHHYHLPSIITFQAPQLLFSLLLSWNRNNTLKSVLDILISCNFHIFKLIIHENMSILFPKIFLYYAVSNISVWFLEPILNCKLKCHRLQSLFAQQTRVFGHDITSIICCCKYISLERIKSKSDTCLCSVWTGFIKSKDSHVKVNVWRVYTFWQ